MTTNYFDRLTTFVEGVKVRATDLNAEFDAVEAGFDAVAADVDAAALSVTTAGSNTTSTTSNSIGTGSKTWTVQTGKSIVVGMFYRMANTASPTTFAAGTVTAYDSATGSLTLSVSITSGSGTYTAWTGSLTVAIAGGTMIRRAVTGTDTVLAGDNQGLIDVTSGTFTLSFSAAASLGSGFSCVIRNSGTGVVTLDPSGSETIDGATTLVLPPGLALWVQSDGTALRTMRVEENGSLYTQATATITADRTLTAASARTQSIAATEIGCCVILPSASTLAVGVEFFLRNTGSTPIGIRNGSSTLLGAVEGGKSVTVSCVDASSTAGVWAINGDGKLPGLVTVDTTLSSTYGSSNITQYVNLDDNKSIHFAAITANGFAALVMDSQSKTSGTPVSVETGASTTVLAAFKISTTSAIVFWKQSTNYRCAVLSISGTTVTVNTTYTTTTNWSPGTDDDGIAPPKFVQLSTSLYLVVDTVSTTDLCATAISVSGTVCTIGTRVTAAVTDLVADSAQTYVIDGTTAMVFYRSSNAGSAPLTNRARVVTVAGTVPTFNTAVAVTGVQARATFATAATAQLTTSLYVIADDNNTTTSVTAAALSVSGTTVTAGTAVTVDSSLTGSSIAQRGANAANISKFNRGLTRMSDSTALVTYAQGGTAGTQSRAVVLSVSGTTTTVGSILQGSFSSDVSSSTTGYGAAFQASPGEMLTAVQIYVGSAPYSIFVPHRISGTTVTAGAAIECGATIHFTPAISRGVKLASNGNYLAMATGTVGGSLRVLASDGRSVVQRGAIGLPWQSSNNGSGWSMADLGNGSLVRTPTNGQVGSTQLLRLVRVEVAA